MDVTMAAAKGENLGKVGLNVACDQLPPNARTAVDLVGRAARGERIDKVALEGARGALPADVRQGIDVGVALGHGANVQATVASQIEKAPMGALADAMKGAVAESLANPVFQAGASLLTDEQRKGYNVGLGLLNHSGVNETVIRLVRAKLAPEQKIGFDIAASTRVGMIRGGAPKGTPTSVSAFLATKGMVGGSPKQKAAMMSQLAKNKEARSAAALAIRDVEAAKARAKAAPVVLSLYGAATSAGTGFMAGGPIGAAVGAIVGGGHGHGGHGGGGHGHGGGGGHRGGGRGGGWRGGRGWRGGYGGGGGWGYGYPYYGPAYYYDDLLLETDPNTAALAEIMGDPHGDPHNG